MADNTVGTAYVVILPDLSKFPAALKSGVSGPTASAMGDVTKASSGAFGAAATEAEKAGGRIGSALKKGGSDGVGAIKSLQGALNEAGVATSPLLNTVVNLSSKFEDLKARFPALKSGLGDVGTTGEAALGAVGTEAQAAGAAVGVMGTEGEAAATGLTGGLAVLLVALAAVVAFAVKGVSSYLDLTASVRAFQRVAGSSAEDASKMVAAANALGISSDSLARGIFKMNSAATTSPQKFKDLGIEIAHTSSGAVDSIGTFNNVAEAVHKAGVGAQSSTIATAAFGKAGRDLLPILLKGTEGLNQFFDAAQRRGDVFNQKDLDQAAAFSRNMRELGTDVGALGRQLAQSLLPALSGLISVATVVVGVISSLSNVIGGALHNSVVRIGVELALVAGILGPIGIAVGLVAVAMEVFGGSSDKAARSAANAAAAMAEVGKQSQDLQGAAVGFLQAQNAEVNATNGLTNANKSLAKAQADLSTLKRQGAVDSKAVHSALEGEESAVHGVETATRSLSQAQQAFNKLAAGPDVKTLATDMRTLDTATDSVAKAVDRVTAAKQALDLVLLGPSARDLATASEDVTKAQNAQQRSTISLADAEQHLQDLRDAADPLKLAQAQVAVDKATAQLAATQGNAGASAAQLALAHATLADAQNKLAALQAIGTPTARDLALANLDVQSANLSATDATQAVADAQTNLTKVQNEGKAGSDALTAAQGALATEEENLTNAIQAQTDAQGRIDDLRAASLPGSDQYRAAQQAVADAVYGVAQAHQHAKDASDALRTAQAGDPAFAQKLVDANDAVSAAQQGVANAKLADLVATLGLTTAGTKLADSLGTDQGVIDQLRTDFETIAKTKPELSDLFGQVIELLGGANAPAQNYKQDVTGFTLAQKLRAVGFAEADIKTATEAVAAGFSAHDILQKIRDIGHGPNGLQLPPGFAQGGWVGGGYPGEPVLIMAHVGEKVQTAAQAKGSGVTILQPMTFNGPVDRHVLPDIQAMIDASNRKLLDALRARGAA